MASTHALTKAGLLNLKAGNYATRLGSSTTRGLKGADFRQPSLKCQPTCAGVGEWLVIYHEYITDLGIQYFCCVKRSDLGTLMDVMERLAQSPGPEGDLGNLSLFDLRSVDLSSVRSSHFESFIRRRMLLGGGSTGNPCVILVRDMVSFGMIRMYGALADFRGLRQEDQMCVTTAVDEAIGWIEKRVEFHDRDQIAKGLALAESRARS